MASGNKPLPADWSGWFPECIMTHLNIRGTRVTARHILMYAMARIADVDDSRYLEAAQCLALLHYLESPTMDTVVVDTSEGD